ncbi:MAG: YidB family protein [Burkholderiales bacterium]
MGLLDGLLGQLMGGGQVDPRQQGMPGGMGGLGAAGGAALIGVVLQLLQRNGGLGGLLSQMQQAGYGSQAQSWIGTGQNEAISPDVLSKIFGQGQMQDIARELGMSHDEAASTVAHALPNVVDRMTPGGAIAHDSDDLVARTLQELMRK